MFFRAIMLLRDVPIETPQNDYKANDFAKRGPSTEFLIGDVVNMNESESSRVSRSTTTTE